MSTQRRLMERAVSKVLDRLASARSKRARGVEVELRSAVQREGEVRNADAARMARLESLLRLRAPMQEALALLSKEVALLEREGLGASGRAEHPPEHDDWDAYETDRLAAELAKGTAHVESLLGALDEDLSRATAHKLALAELQRHLEDGAALTGMSLDDLLAEV